MQIITILATQANINPSLEAHFICGYEQKNADFLDGYSVIHTSFPKNKFKLE